MTIAIRQTTSADVALMAASMREYDLAILADYVSDVPPSVVLSFAVANASWVRSIEDDEGLVAILGITPDRRDPTIGGPWMIATNRLRHHRGWIVKNIRDLIAQGDEGRYRIHAGEFPVDDKRIRRWIQWCGYTLGHLVQTPKGATYITFEGSPPCRGSSQPPL